MRISSKRLIIFFIVLIVMLASFLFTAKVIWNIMWIGKLLILATVVTVIAFYFIFRK